MKVHQLQDQLAGIAAKHGNIDVVLIDPTKPIEATSATWTSAIGLFVTDTAEDNDDGTTATVLLIIPNPENARTVDADGNSKPLFA